MASVPLGPGDFLLCTNLTYAAVRHPCTRPFHQPLHQHIRAAVHTSRHQHAACRLFAYPSTSPCISTFTLQATCISIALLQSSYHHRACVVLELTCPQARPQTRAFIVMLHCNRIYYAVSNPCNMNCMTLQLLSVSIVLVWFALIKYLFTFNSFSARVSVFKPSCPGCELLTNRDTPHRSHAKN